MNDNTDLEIETVQALCNIAVHLLDRLHAATSENKVKFLQAQLAQVITRLTK